MKRNSRKSRETIARPLARHGSSLDHDRIGYDHLHFSCDLREADVALPKKVVEGGRKALTFFQLLANSRIKDELSRSLFVSRKRIEEDWPNREENRKVASKFSRLTLRTSSSSSSSSKPLQRYAC
ncbi:hypothetical protein KPH14_002401 [Odynerus spinipes]|uniref:Uncharacterized protein n=1 Tax=Odynerus spinipes TaxID=1348599 RepID=A0AAD9RMQ6_9HYME|nr:hypothetical protein KPH14_002401 [Odynerus spinipes]